MSAIPILLVLVICVGRVCVQEHTHQPPYYPPNPNVHPNPQPYGQRHHQQPAHHLKPQPVHQTQPHPNPRPPSLSPAQPVHTRVETTESSSVDKLHAHFPSDLLAESLGRRVEDTQVQCLKTHMLVTFRFSSPFSGYIYPHQHFTECLLFHGQNSLEASLQLKHGTCGDQENRIFHQGHSFLDPVIEHRLMVQWEPDIVCEDDSSVIVRCDRPDDYNKTVEWKLETRNLLATVERSTHPGPKMWMEIQRGEGPTAPPLTDEVVYIGDIMTLVFTLSDNVYWFDSNIFTCYAVDGGEEKKQIQWESNEKSQITPRSRAYIGETTVIENGCSVKPKIFSHFHKEKHNRPSGELVTLHYAYFKAFRFPTSMKIVIQCNVQVCYKECLEPAPCSDAFHPRIHEERKRRRRRQAEAAAEEGAHEVDQVQLFRSIDVFMPEEGGEKKIRVSSPIVAQALQDFCYSPTMYYATVIGLICVIILLLIVVCLICFKSRMPNVSFFTPTKSSK